MENDILHDTLLDEILKNKDFRYIKNINKYGIKYLHERLEENYINEKKFIDLYFLLYSSKINIDNESEIDYLINNIIIKEPNFILNLISTDNNIDKVLIEKFIKNLLKIIYVLDLESKIEIYNTFFLNKKSNYFLEIIINNSSYNGESFQCNFEKSILGNIINSIDLSEKNYKNNINLVTNYIFSKKYLNSGNYVNIINWLKNLILKNKDNTKISNILIPNRNLTSLELLNNVLIISIKQVMNIKKLDNMIDTTNLDLDIENKIDTYSDDTKIFIYCLKIIDISIIPLILRYNIYIKNLTNINVLIQNEGSNTFIENLYINSIKIEKKTLKKKIENIIKILDNEYYIESLLLFINNIVKFFGNQLSENFIENISTIINYYDNIFNNFIVGNNFQNLFELLFNVIGNKFENIKLHIKIKILNFLSINNDIIINLFIKNNLTILLEKYLINSIHLYININKNEEEQKINSLRLDINRIFATFYSNYKKIINKCNLIKLPDFNKFFFILLTDTNNHFENSILIINKILNKEHSDNSYLYDSLYFFILYFKSGIILIEEIIKFYKYDIIKSSIILDKLIKYINFWNSKLVNDSNIRLFNFNKYFLDNFNWNIMYKCTGLIYNTYYDSNSFIKLMKKDNMFYCNDLIINLDIIQNSKRYNYNNLNELVKNIDLIKNSKKKNEYKNKFPDEFCDPLLFTPIKNPVILPESQLFIDIKSISNHLINDETDPFNRTKLTLDELEEFNLLPVNIKKITEFKKKILDWKNKNRI